MADPTLGTAVLRTRLDKSGLTRGLNDAKSETKSATTSMRDSFAEVGVGIAAVAGGLWAARGVITGMNTLATNSERAANAQIIFDKQIRRSGESSDQAAALVERLSDRFGVLPQTVQEATTIMLRAGGSLDDVERALTAAGASAAATGFDISTSFDNVSVAVATGRSELLETSGIIANLGPVQQAYAKSIGKTVEELTDAELVQARVNAIYRESKPEIEDVDQLLSGLAGTNSATRSAFSETRNEIGERFIPIMTSLSRTVGGAFRAFNDLPDPVQTTAVAIGGVVAIGGPAVTILGGIVTLAPRVKTAFVTMATGVQTFGTAAKVVFGPLGVLAAGLGIVVAIANKILEATNRMNEFAAAGINVQGLSDEAARIQESIFALQEAREGVIEQFRANGLQGDELDAAIARYDGKIQALRDSFGEAVREAAELRDAQAELGSTDTDVDVNLKVEGGEGIPTDGEVRQLTIQVTTEDREEARAARRRQASTNTPQSVIDSHLERQGIMNGTLRNDPQSLLTALGRFGQGGFLNADAAEAVGHNVARGIDAELERQRTGEEMGAAFDRFGSGASNDRARAGNALSPRGIDFPTVEETRQLNREHVALINEMNQMFGRFAGGRGRDANGAAREQVEDQVFRNIDEINRAAAAQVELSGAFARFATISTGADRTTQVFSPGQATLDGRRGLTAGDQAFNANQFAFRPRETSGEDIDAAKEANEARVIQQAAADDFAQTVVNAAATFATDLVGAIRNGDIGAAFQAVLKGGQSILGGADFGGLSFLGGTIPIAGLISAGLGIFGSILGGLFGGGNKEDEQAQAAAEAARRGAPAVNINFVFNQSNTYQGGPTDPANENAFRRQAIIAFEEFMNRTKIPQRLAALEGNA